MSEFGKELRTETGEPRHCPRHDHRRDQDQRPLPAALEEEPFRTTARRSFQQGNRAQLCARCRAGRRSLGQPLHGRLPASGQVKDDDASWIAFAENVGKSATTKDDRPDLRLRWAGVAVLLVASIGAGLVRLALRQQSGHRPVRIPQTRRACRRHCGADLLALQACCAAPRLTCRSPTLISPLTDFVFPFADLLCPRHPRV